eukprot:10777235-Heterocapsa_arctica.AAC.1
MCPIAEGSNVSAPALLPQFQLRKSPSEPGGVLLGGSFEDRSGTVPHGSPHHPLLIDPTIAAPEGERTTPMR